jgi:hypothetical protein
MYRSVWRVAIAAETDLPDEVTAALRLVSGGPVLSSRKLFLLRCAEFMDPTAVSDQIERILRSQSFASKAQLRKLLGILSKNIDSQSALNPDLVIKELWPDEIKTKRSADVATEMNRLRHALEAYYGGEGESDPVTIILPNRAAPGPDGTPEKRWIVAKPRGENGADPASAQAKPHGGRRRLAAIAAIAAALGIVAYVSMQVLTAHGEPKLGRLDGSALVIMNAEGKELWRKVFPEGLGPDWFYAQGLASRIWFADLEGKGHTSVLFVYAPAGPLSRSSTLICYSDRGTERWRWTPGRELPEFGGSPATFVTIAVAVLKATDQRPRRIVVSSQHHPWWENQMAVLDVGGKVISEYWHSGALSYLALADLYGDGKEEIVATGVNNGYLQATLVVLDPDQVFGASTEVRPSFQIHGMGAAQEKLRLLFPRSDLNKALFSFNAATEPTVEHGSIRLTVGECLTPTGCFVWYEFDKNLRLISAYAGDDFRSNHARFYQNGKDAHFFTPVEQAELQKVRCLVGCKSEFVRVVNIP